MKHIKWETFLLVVVMTDYRNMTNEELREEVSAQGIANWNPLAQEVAIRFLVADDRQAVADKAADVAAYASGILEAAQGIIETVEKKA